MSLEVFRRNQKILMAALTLMSMISFVFLDDTMRAGTTYLVPLILAILFGGGAFVWGTKQGKQNEYLAMGALVGAVLGLVVTTFGGRDPYEQPAVAGLSPRAIANLKSRRESANRIVAAIVRKSHPISEEMAKSPFGQQIHQFTLQRQIEQFQFTFGNDDIEKDVVFGELLRREADRLGIVINDEAISDFIKLVSNHKLTTQAFREIKQELHLGDHYIYDLLRDQIAARKAAEMTFPRLAATPQQRWQDFRKVHVKNAIEATTIPVDAFVKSVSAPSDTELLAFFKEHAEKYPSPKGDPGFRQPMRVRLAYLEADYETIEAKVPQPTDEEVANYYEQNKELFIDRTPPATEKKDELTTDGENSTKPATDDAKKEDSKSSDDKGGPKDAQPQKSDKPADSKTDKPDTNAVKSDKPDDSKQKTSEQPKSEKPAEDAKKPENPDKSSDAEKSPSANDSDADDGDDGDAQKDVENQSNQPQANADKPDDANKAENKSAPNTEPPKANADAPSDKKSDNDQKPDQKPTSDAKDASGQDDQPPKDDKAPAKSDDKEKSDDESEKKPELKYKPFEDVKDKIHDDLLRSRTLDEMKKRIDTVVARMRRLGSYTIADKNSKSYKSPEEVATELRELAQSLDLKYVETPLLSAEELSQSEDHKIGGATDPQDDSFSRQGSATVIQRVFGRGNDSTFTPEVAEDRDTKNRFAYWVIERKEAHVPKFEDEGIRDQVLKAWKLMKATPQAEERAKALAKLAAPGKRLAEVLAGETVTGEKDGQQLTVIEPKEKFSHFTVSGQMAPQLNPLQPGNERVELPRIPGLDKLGDDFFAAIDKLKPGETAAIPNIDRSAFIVVHVTEREEVSPEEDAPQRAEFMKTWPHSTSAHQLAMFEFEPLRRQWMESIERKYNVKWPVK